MFSFILDASAAAKRYAPELGTPLVNRLFARTRPDRLHILNVGAAEVVSVLVRKKNRGHFSADALTRALAIFVAEILHSPTFNKFEIDNRIMLAAVPLIISHSVNSTDAIVLQVELDLAARLRLVGDDAAIVTSDVRLIKAASAEGLVTFDPETQSQTALDALIGP